MIARATRFRIRRRPDGIHLPDQFTADVVWRFGHWRPDFEVEGRGPRSITLFSPDIRFQAQPNTSALERAHAVQANDAPHVRISAAHGDAALLMRVLGVHAGGQRLHQRQVRRRHRHAGAYTRPLLSSISAVSDTEYTLRKHPIPPNNP